MRLLIIAGDPLARAGLAALLHHYETFIIVGQVADDTDLSAAVEIYLPDILLFDLGWEPGPGLEQLTQLQPFELPTLVLLPDETIAADAAAAGAKGLFLRETTPAHLVAALTAIDQGIMAIDPLLFQSLLPRQASPPQSLTDPLTPREIDVLQHLAQGLSNKAIARELTISEHTVKFHVNAVMSKLSAQSRTEAVVRATQLGLILL